MTAGRLSRSAFALALVLTPVLGLVAALAHPALRSSAPAEVAAVAAQPDRFYVYALGILLSSYLSVPAFFGVMAVLRERAPVWSVLAGGLTQVGLLISIGDAATELVYWQMGAAGADREQMAALADRYENVAGSSLVYLVGGLSSLVGALLLATGLWRTRAVPRWVAAGVVVGVVANVVGFMSESRPILVAGYLVLLAAFVAIAIRLWAEPLDGDPSVTTAPPLVAGGERS